MGIYVNPGNEEFKRAVNSKIYVDKTMLLAYTNQNLNTEHQNICVSRPRRFGKSMAANMLVAYYGKGDDSYELFQPFKIAKDPSFQEHLNQYNAIHPNRQELPAMERRFYRKCPKKKTFRWKALSVMRRRSPTVFCTPSI